MSVSRADNSVKNWRNLPISNPKPDLHNINAHTKFGENPLMFAQVIIRKRKTDGRTMDGQTDDQRESITPRHYCVAGYNKTQFGLFSLFKEHRNRLIWFYFIFSIFSIRTLCHDHLTLALLNLDIPCICKQCRSRSVGFWRSQLIWICTVCHSVCEFISTSWIK